MKEGDKKYEAGSFHEMVQNYGSRMMNVLHMTVQYGDIPVEQKVLRYKVDKHLAEGNVREVAMYIALYLKEYGPVNFPKEVGDIARSLKLDHNKERGEVGYPHKDGTYHYFDAKGGA